MGRKHREKQTRKPRLERIYATTTGDVRELVIRVNQMTGEFEFRQPMENVFSEVSYERPKGDKVLNRVPQTSAKLSFNIQRALLAHFDFTVAVDTNSRIIGGRNVSVTAVVIFSEAPSSPAEGRSWKLDVPFCWEFIDLKTDKIENFGWLAAHERLRSAGYIADGTRVGMVVDSDLGNIPAFNSRTSPFFENRLLPPDIQLIYASADSGGENVVNQVLKAADSVSAQVLDAVERGDIPFNLCDKPSEWYAGHRRIDPDLRHL